MKKIKEKKVVIIILIASCLIWILALSWMLWHTNTPQYWDIKQEYSEIEKIQFIDIKSQEGILFVFEDTNTYDVIGELDVSYANELFEDIKKLEYNHYIGAPKSPRDLSILIKFNNGEYEIISYSEPGHGKYDEDKQRIVWQSERLMIDHNEFEEQLINKYISLIQ